MSDTQSPTEDSRDRSTLRSLPEGREGTRREGRSEQGGQNHEAEIEEARSRTTTETVKRGQATVQGRIELSGPFDEMLEYFEPSQGGADRPTHLEDINRDMDTLLTVVEEQGGGIRSKLAREADLRVGEENIRCMLEMLRSYGLLELDQNTWVPGPEFDRR